METLLNNPYPGIRPFREEDSAYFFGRSHLTNELLRKLQHKKFISVVGTSGCGKSSIIRAGLLPRLKEQGWNVVVMRPLDDPINRLADELKKIEFVTEEIEGDGDSSELNNEEFRNVWEEMIPVTLSLTSQGIIDTYIQSHSTKKLLIVVDQFEELLKFKSTGYDNRETAIKFVNLLIQAAIDKEYPIHIIITMRSDFLGYCAQFKGLPELINEGQFLVPRLTRDQHREAIIGPLEKEGIRIASNVVSQLLNDIEDDPDQLPILQHAMMLTFDEWHRKDQNNDGISLSHYETIGGMARSIDAHCKQVLLELKAKGLEHATEIIFQRLTGVNLEGVETRNPATVEELITLTGLSVPRISEILDAFRKEGRNFLIPSFESDPSLELSTVIDLTHECIMRKWSDLQRWISKEEEDKRMLMKLIEHANNYTLGERGPLKNPTLSGYLGWKRFLNAGENKTLYWSKRYTDQFPVAVRFVQISKKWSDRNRRIKKLAYAFVLLGIVSLLIYSQSSHEEQVKHLTSDNESLLNRVQSLNEHVATLENSLADEKELNKPDALRLLQSKNKELDKKNESMTLQNRVLHDSITTLLSSLKDFAHKNSEYEQRISSVSVHEKSAQLMADGLRMELTEKEIEDERLIKLYKDSLNHQKALVLKEYYALQHERALLTREKAMREFFSEEFAEELKKNKSLIDEFERKVRAKVEENKMDKAATEPLHDYIAFHREKLSKVLGRLPRNHTFVLYAKQVNANSKFEEFKKLLQMEGYNGQYIEKPFRPELFDQIDGKGVVVITPDLDIHGLIATVLKTSGFKNLSINESFKADKIDYKIQKGNELTTVLLLDYD